MSEVTIDESKLTKLKGQVVFITGGAQGLGFAAAKVFQRLGSKVVIGDIRIPDSREAGFDYLLCDITNWSSLSAAMKTTVDRYGSLDVLIANAGIGEVEDFFQDELDEDGDLKAPRHSVVDVNLKGTMNCIKFAIHYMRKQANGGAIVITASSAGYMAEKKIPAYAATKHGVCTSLPDAAIQRADMYVDRWTSAMSCTKCWPIQHYHQYCRTVVYGVSIDD